MRIESNRPFPVGIPRRQQQNMQPPNFAKQVTAARNDKYHYTLRVQVDYVEQEEPDYSTMSEVEIYNSIVEKYQSRYGEDFLERDILGFSPKQGDDMVYCRFEQDLEKHLGGDFKKVREVARQAAYGDLSPEEVRSKIAGDYAGTPMTLEDFMRMTYEMKRVGVDVGLRELAEQMRIVPDGSFYHGTPDEVDANFMTLLDKPLNMEALVINANGMRYANNPSFTGLTSQFLASYFHLRYGSNGYFSEELGYLNF